MPKALRVSCFNLHASWASADGGGGGAGSPPVGRTLTLSIILNTSSRTPSLYLPYFLGTQQQRAPTLPHDDKPDSQWELRCVRGASGGLKSDEPAAMCRRERGNSASFSYHPLASLCTAHACAQVLTRGASGPAACAKRGMKRPRAPS